MSRRILPVLLLLVVLVPLAYAFPPDQTWIGGFYDNADYDDVCLLVMASVASVEQPTVCAEPLTVLTTPLVALASDDGLSSGIATTLHVRAPPVA